MTTYRENLIDRMIRLYGFENPMVVQFAEMCEKYPNNADYDNGLQLLVEAHEEYPIFEED